MFKIIYIPLVALYGYACTRCWHRVFKKVPKLHWIAYALLCSLFAAIFLVYRSTIILPSQLLGIVANIGGYWLAFAFYLILCTLLLDALMLARKPIAAFMRKHALGVGLLAIAASCIIVAAGAFNAGHPRIKQYEIGIQANQKNETQLNVIMVSDIHLDEYDGFAQLTSLVQKINALSPDIVLIAGDIFDNATVSLRNATQIKSEFSKIKAHYGVYACLGNHDSYDGGAAAIGFFDDTNVHLLVDESVVVDDRFVLLGRKDARDKNRESIANLMQGTQNLPVIVLDHQPSDLAKEEAAGVSLVLCGHTHDGQLFPVNILTGIAYDVSYGYAKRGKMHAVVSSGYGVWATPVRVGSYSEIVQIYLKLSQ